MALAAIADGKNRTKAAAVGLMDRQTLRDWVIRFNEEGPANHVPGLIRWRCIDLVPIVKERFGVECHQETIGKILRELGFSHISPRPQHPKQDEQAIEQYKNFADLLAETTKDLVPGTAVEIWFQDEAGVGQKNGLVYQWAKKGTRPRQPKDQRYASCYIFGAVCPARDVGAALVMPYADTEAMQKHLDEIAQNVRPKAHTVILMDGAGWHKSGDLNIPQNISLMFIPPYSPELNPVENVWQFLRQTYLSNQVFEDYDNIVDACCKAWNSLINDAGRITSIASRKWAINGQ